MIDHVVITGGAGAIGRALATLLRRTQPSTRLTLVDRDEAGLHEAQRALGGDTAIAAWDLEELDALPTRVESLGPIDALVNNAGFMEMRSLTAMPWALGEKLLTVDLLSPMRLMALVAPPMVARRRGTIVNVASMAGVVPLRGCVYYGAAKAGLAMASEVAHAELAEHGVHVVTVYPGPIRSQLEARARAQMPSTWLSRAIPLGDPHVLAEKIAVAMQRREARVIYPRFYDLASRIAPLAARFTQRFSPRALDEDTA